MVAFATYSSRRPPEAATASMAAAIALLLLALVPSSVHAQPAPLGVVAFAAGEGHTCVLTGANGVKCWGRNAEGQLGDNTATPRLVAVDVAGLPSGVAQIAAGGFHTCALTAEVNPGQGGGVKCWGSNAFGQLGDGTTTPRVAPVPVQELGTGVTAIAAGHDFTCAVTKAGGVKCWGDNDNGELGIGTVVPQLTAVDVLGASNVKSLAAGLDHVCALTNAGSVFCWGRNILGQLGDGTTTMRPTPVAVTGLGATVVAITAGNEHTCALTSTGGAKCWGNNAFGQLGNGTNTPTPTPIDVPPLMSGVVQIVAGGQHTCALLSDGSARCWGWNGNGQLGDGSVTWQPVPVGVLGLGGGVTALAGGQKHTCALTNTGGVLCWGADTEGQLGDGASGVDRLQPANVNLQPFASFNYQGLWWNPAESGWGVNFAHQADVIFASWFTYDVDGSPLWMVMAATKTGPNTYVGDIYRAVGPPFFAVPFDPSKVVGTLVGTGTLTFSDARNATFAYTIGGLTQSKAITRQVFATPEPSCSWSANADIAGATNYQDLWWKEPHGSESGWGINLTHQGATIYATWYTYDGFGKPWWLVAAASRVAPKTYSGKVFTAQSGPAYNAAPFDPSNVKPLEVGTLTLTFDDGGHGMLDATILETRIIRPIMRESFAGTGAATVCTPTEAVTACKVSVNTGFTGDLNATYDNTGSGAGGGGGGGGGGGAGGGAGEGKVLGALVTVTRLRDGVAIGAAVTDMQQGLITIRACETDWPMLLTATGQPGAKYYDEATNTLSDFGPGRVLHALIDQLDENVALSTFSEAAYQYAINNYLPGAAAIAQGAAPLKAQGDPTGLRLFQVREANTTILNEINRHLPNALQMTSLKSLPTPIDAASSNGALPRNRYGRAAAALGGYAMMLGDYKPGSLHPVADAAQEMARDLTDGRIDGFALDGSVAAQSGTPRYDRDRFGPALNVGANKLTKRFSSSGSNNIFADTPTFVEAMIFDNGPLQDFGMVDQRFEYASLDKNGNLNLARTDCGHVGSCNQPIVRISRFMTDVKQVEQNALGSGYIVRNNGQVMSWGPANCGLLGNNQQSDDAIDGPVGIGGVSNFTSIAATETAAVGRDANGNVYSWGADLYGILGLGNGEKQASCNILLYLGGSRNVDANMKPTKIPGLSNIVSLHSNQLSMFAIDAAGHVYGWGSGFYYDFGDGTRADRSTPAPVPGLTNIRTLAFTFDTVFALRSDGHVVAWGRNLEATFGDGTNTPKPTPQVVPNVSQLVTLVADQDVAVYGMTANGTMVYWGAPSHGLPATPTVVQFLPPIRDIKAGRTYVYAYTRDGRVFAAASGALIQTPSGAVVPAFADVTSRLTGQ